jgi:hypothetical protein
MSKGRGMPDLDAVGSARQALDNGTVQLILAGCQLRSALANTDARPGLTGADIVGSDLAAHAAISLAEHFEHLIRQGLTTSEALVGVRRSPSFEHLCSYLALPAIAAAIRLEGGE